MLFKIQLRNPKCTGCAQGDACLVGPQLPHRFKKNMSIVGHLLFYRAMYCGPPDPHESRTLNVALNCDYLALARLMPRLGFPFKVTPQGEGWGVKPVPCSSSFSPFL